MTSTMARAFIDYFASVVSRTNRVEPFTTFLALMAGEGLPISSPPDHFLVGECGFVVGIYILGGILRWLEVWVFCDLEPLR
jgi:hypothetical protein